GWAAGQSRCAPRGVRMTEQRPRRERSLFEQAADLPLADQRAFLNVCCPADPKLRARVEHLLACDARLRAEEGELGLLDSPLVRPQDKPTAPDPFPATELPLGAAAAAKAGALPARLGRYEVLEEIGRGGMGCVLRGHDPELGRDLAVKVLLHDHQHDPTT